MPYLRRKVHDSPASLERMFVRTHVRSYTCLTLCPLAPLPLPLGLCQVPRPLPLPCPSGLCQVAPSDEVIEHTFTPSPSSPDRTHVRRTPVHP